MYAQPEPRFKKRLACSVRRGPSAYSGMVVDLSRTGLFVQTGAGAKPGESVHLSLGASRDESGIPLMARVVWQRKVPPQLRQVAEGGIGVEIEYAPEAYYALLAEVARVSTASRRSVADRRSQAQLREAGSTEKTKYRLRMKQLGRPRSRILRVSGETEDDARKRALARVGEDWEIVEVEEAR